MKNRFGRRVALYLALSISCFFAFGCAPAAKPAEPSATLEPTPAPTPALPPIPANTAKSLEGYEELSVREQFSHHSIGSLCALAAAELMPGDGDYEELRAYLEEYMENGGIALPEGYSISHHEGTSLYFSERQREEGEVAAKLFVTNFNTAEGEKSVFATVIELESDYLADDVFPKYIVRDVLLPSAPKNVEYFIQDVDGDGVIDYALRFFKPGVPEAESESECVILRLKDWRFERQSVTLDEWKQAKTGYSRYLNVYAMKSNIEAGINLSAVALESVLSTPYTGKGGKGIKTVSLKNASALTLKHLYDGNGIYSWELALAMPGVIYTAAFSAPGTDGYETFLACVDLTSDGQEEILISILPKNSGGSGAELHVFGVQNGALIEMLTLCDGDPPEKMAEYAPSYFKIPDTFTYEGGALRGDYASRFDRATCILSAGLYSLRISAYKGGQTAYTFLWWNGGAFEVVHQTVFK